MVDLSKSKKILLLKGLPKRPFFTGIGHSFEPFFAFDDHFEEGWDDVILPAPDPQFATLTYEFGEELGDDFSADWVQPTSGTYDATSSAVSYLSFDNPPDRELPPLLGGGIVCRGWTQSGSANGAGKIVCTHPDVFGLDNNKAISVRAWALSSASGSSGVINLLARTTSNLSNSGPSFTTGYHLRFWNSSTSNSNIEVYTATTTSALKIVDTISIGNFYQSWVGLRLDVIPIFDDSDILRVYIGTGTADNPTWTLQKELVVSSNEIQRAAPSPNRGCGFSVWKGGGSVELFIDKFQVFVEDIQ